jgi:hypothetical protein
LNSPPPSFSFISSSPIPGSFNRSHFSIFIYENLLGFLICFRGEGIEGGQREQVSVVFSNANRPYFGVPCSHAILNYSMLKNIMEILHYVFLNEYLQIKI